MRELQAWFFDRWAAAVRRMKFRAPDPRNCPLERVSGPEIGRYVSKVGAATEVARWDRKKGRNGSRAPFQILADIRARKDPSDVRLWHEYEEAMFGVQQLTWSKGLRRLLGLGVDRRDDRVAKERS